MDYDQRLHAQKDKRNKEKTMSMDENVFFREATLRICSSLNIVEALKNCFDYLQGCWTFGDRGKPDRVRHPNPAHSSK
jgi:hypothetical protein